jgi:hypothetical protein
LIDPPWWEIIKYTDPDGEDIYNTTLIGAGVKVVAGGGINWGIAWDDNGNFATLTVAHVGIGVEAGVDTPVTPSFSISKGQNIDDLPGIGPYHYAVGTDVTASIGVSLIFDMDTENGNAQLVGAGLLAIGGSVNKSIAVYCNLKEIPGEILPAIQNFVQENRGKFPENAYNIIMEINKHVEK